MEEIEKERQMLLEQERKKNKPHHCELCGAYIEKDNLRIYDKYASEYEF